MSSTSSHWMRTSYMGFYRHGNYGLINAHTASEMISNNQRKKKGKNNNNKINFHPELFAVLHLLATNRYARGAYHLAKKSGNFGLNSNGKEIFRKFRSEIVEYLQRYSSFSVRNRTAQISLYHLLKFLVSNLSSAENNYGKSNCKWQAPFRSVGLLNLEKPYHYSTFVPTGLF